MDRVFEVVRREGRIAVSLTAVRMGADFCLALCGGDRPHIGAVAVGQPRPSLKNADETSASVSVITLLGHKEDQLAREVARRLAVKTKATVSVACGIHLDGITMDEISAVCRQTDQAVDELEKLLDLSPAIGGDSYEFSPR